jgi:inorganic pyrophosphatase
MDFDVFIEIPAQGSIKYEVDEKLGQLRVDRFLYTAMIYPFNYGYIKDTIGEDGDPLDVIIISSQAVYPGVLMKCHAVGLLEMEDEEGIDTKIIAVPDKKIDPDFGEIKDIKDIAKPTLDKIKHFFEQYKALEPEKWVKCKDFKGKKEAEEIIKKASR